MKKQNMDLNHETAMRLWNKQFGKETKVKDFTGREIAKGAYNNRNSDFGWNVDHILPQCKGGKTADSNLICCHINTNDEKADKFPCFNANGKKFEIIKVQNHYEIHSVEKNNKKKDDKSLDINFYDSASGVRYFKQLKGIQNKNRFVGTVLIRLIDVKNTAVVEFVEKIFEKENLSFTQVNFGCHETKIIAKNYDMPLQSDIEEILDKCILLNTYLSYYFYATEDISGFDIYYRVDCFDDRMNVYGIAQPTRSLLSPLGNIRNSIGNSLFINNLVISNTTAKNKINENRYDDYSEYDIVFTQLQKNLEKEVNGK